MSALNYSYRAARQPDNGSFKVYVLYAQLALPEYADLGTLDRTVQIGIPANPPTFVYATLADAETDFKTNKVPELLDLPNTYFGTSYTLGDALAFDQSIKDAIDAASPLAAVSSMVSRSLNSAFQVSSLRPQDVEYAVDISATISLTGGQSGTVFLEMANNSGFTGTVTTLDEFTASNTGTLTLGLSLTQVITAKLSARNIPIGNYLRIRTSNNTGTPSFTYKRGRETVN